jgi:hypothetical protein
MHIFALERIPEIDGEILFYKLKVNNRVPFDEFEQTITHDKTYLKELRIIQARMQEISEGNLLPETKFRKLISFMGKCKGNEIKTRNLRVYLFHEERTGKIVVCGGKKKDQGKSLGQFRIIMRFYIQHKIR